MKTGRENIELQTSHPNYGKVVKSADGRIICHICGKPFRKLGAHVVQKHGITSWVYKVMFGLDVIKGLVSDEHRQHLSDCAKRNYDVSIKKNLIEGGTATRFAKHSKEKKATWRLYRTSLSTMPSWKKQTMSTCNFAISVGQTWELGEPCMKLPRKTSTRMSSSTHIPCYMTVKTTS